jgi:ectoine hydroxylase-related dioxygenase (phytanoyl-CoA dioxygenase family)
MNPSAESYRPFAIHNRHVDLIFSQPMASTGEIVEGIQREGYVVVPDLLSQREVGEIKASLAPWLRGQLMGRNDFEGLHTERVYALLAKATPVARIVEHPDVIAVLNELLTPHYRLSACLAIQVHPGETAQGWHADDSYVPLARPRSMMGVSTIWAFDDSTEENGATEVIPGSHLWGPEERAAPDDHRAVKVLMRAGSAVFFAGTLFHRGGPHRGTNTRLAITPQYCEPWVRQIENMVLAVPPKIARRYSERIQELLGYDIFEPTFIGYVDGMHPKRLLGPAYAAQGERPKIIVPE